MGIVAILITCILVCGISLGYVLSSYRCYKNCEKQKTQIIEQCEKDKRKMLNHFDMLIEESYQDCSNKMNQLVRSIK